MTEPEPTALSSHTIPTRPRLRAGFSAIPGPAETTVYSPRVRWADAIDDPDGVWYALMRLLDGRTALVDVHRRLREQGHELSLEDVADGVSALAESGIVVEGAGD